MKKAFVTPENESIFHGNGIAHYWGINEGRFKYPKEIPQHSLSDITYKNAKPTEKLATVENLYPHVALSWKTRYDL